MRKVAPLLLTLLILALAYVTNVPEQFGAHPQWSQVNLLIGGSLGIVTAFFATFLPGPAPIKMAAFTLLAAFFVWAAQTGGIQFATTYAEDKQAGQLWYLGWIAAPAAVAALLYTTTEWALAQNA